ncbi:hypothetical protein KQX54_007866 [Cotesia glomerata]|uniref:Uncharacterized protein n=1 Tax=Cotesia glomerata TaxID=32391 RepID=A0AAV7HXY3_COTGL|nr:hypothetical protein KQX54_007866 [Cotesia glomerata]
MKERQSQSSCQERDKMILKTNAACANSMHLLMEHAPAWDVSVSGYLSRCPVGKLLPAVHSTRTAPPSQVQLIHEQKTPERKEQSRSRTTKIRNSRRREGITGRFS